MIVYPIVVVIAFVAAIAVWTCLFSRASFRERSKAIYGWTIDGQHDPYNKDILDFHGFLSISIRLNKSVITN